MACPDYYLLTSGREFFEFANHELSAWLVPRVTHDTYHCIISAMEHRFRCGLKEGETETDKQAEAYWLTKAEECHRNATHRMISADDLEDDYEWDSVLPVALMMVDSERSRKLRTSW